MIGIVSKMFLLLSVVTLSSTIGTVKGQEYMYIDHIGGWIKRHKLAASWDDAYEKCRQEGAELVIPTTDNIVNVLRFSSGEDKDSAAYFIGVKQRYVRGVFETDEGVSLYDLPVMGMVDSLNPDLGECLSIDRYHIRVVNCYSKLPFACYRKRSESDTMTECGTYDKQYKFNATTGSCYKYHTQKSSWYEAYEICVNEGGYLAVINNEKEAWTIGAMFPTDTAFVGLQALNKDGIWTIVRGDPKTITYKQETLKKGLKTDTIRFAQRDTEHCGAITDYLRITGMDCNRKENFICERDPHNEKRFTFGEL